jgi:hypothetical protein
MALFMAAIARISFGLIRSPFLRRALGNRKRILYLVVGIQVQRMESDNSETAWYHTTTALGTHSRILRSTALVFGIIRRLDSCHRALLNEIASDLCVGLDVPCQLS